MKLRIPATKFPFRFQTRLGEVQIVIANGGFIAAEFEMTTAAAFAVRTNSETSRAPVQISSLKNSYGEVEEHLLTGFELPFDISPDDEFMAAVIDGLLEDAHVQEIYPKTNNGRQSQGISDHATP